MSTTQTALRRNRGLSKKWHDAIFIIVMLAVPVVHFLVFSVYLNLNTVFLSFQHKNADGAYVFWENPFTNYVRFFNESFRSYSDFPACIANSLLYFALNDFVIVPLSVILTYFLYKKIFLHKFFRVVFYLPCIVSMVVMVMVYCFLFNPQIGIVNPILEALGLERIIPEDGWMATRASGTGLIVGYCIWSGLGGNFILLCSAMQRIPDEIIEAGKLDGVGFYRALVSITVPLIGTTLATLFMMGTTVIFTFFLQVKLITGGEHKTGTIMFYITETVKGNSHDLSGAATVGMIVAVVGTPIVLATRYIVDKVFPSYEF